MRHFGTHTPRLIAWVYFFSFSSIFASSGVGCLGIGGGGGVLVAEEAWEVENVAAGEADEGVGF